MNLDLEDFKTTKKLTAKVDIGDLYLKGPCVYRISLYNDTDDKVILETTNDDLGDNISSWTPRVELRRLGFVECPLALRGPAYDVFDLKDKPTPDSIVALNRYRNDNNWVYKKLLIEDLFEFVNELETRSFLVPQGLADVTKNLVAGQLVRVAYLFYTLTKEDAKKLYKDHNVDPITYKHAMNYKSWPIVYVPKRFEENL